jgi:hypothetical protein
LLHERAAAVVEIEIMARFASPSRVLRAVRGVSYLIAPLVFAGALGCEPEIGSPCDPDDKLVASLLKPKKGTNNLVQDVRLDNCSQGLCASVDGSRGFCTVRCEDDLECTGAGAAFGCGKIIEFGPLACRDYDDKKDCLTEKDADTGAPEFSKEPLLYCKASASAIEQRDVDYGRKK